MAKRWMEDKNKVKDIFDHVRNFLISGAVFFAALYSFQTASTYRGGLVLGVLVGLALTVAFFVLVTANLVQGFKILFPKPNSVKSWVKKGAVALLIFFYVLCAIQLVDSVYKPRLQQGNAAQTNQES